jgi:hypothetical protein
VGSSGQFGEFNGETSGWRLFNGRTVLCHTTITFNLPPSGHSSIPFTECANQKNGGVQAFAQVFARIRGLACALK